jgi:uncharacterized DUF497 family protein
MIFDWDAGNRTKCQKHGLSLEDIEWAMTGDPKVAPDIDHSMTEQRFIAIGRIKDGRYVFIAFCWRGKLCRPISARFMHKREVDRYVKT